MTDKNGEQTILIWLRKDLRLHDNPALRAAMASGRRVYCLYILENEEDGLRPPGGASRWWLHQALASLDESLRPLTGGLILDRGAASTLLPQWVDRLGVNEVHWNRRYGAAEIALDSALKACLRARLVSVHSHNASLLAEPWDVATKDGNPFKVYTPFAKAVRALGTPPRPQPAPDASRDVATDLTGLGLPLSTLNLRPTKPDWAGGLEATWQPGEAAALARLDDFVADGLNRYDRMRDFPGDTATSRLSPYLAFGEISPRLIWHRTEVSDAPRAAIDKFHAELLWREFSYHLLYHFKDLPTRNFQPRFDGFTWAEPDATLMKRWQTGMTGYPIVDAGMRELWQTGTMHNRVRMVVASFLVKHMLIDWRHGEAWFWDTLVDADAANNAASWQWVAGTGADAAPYFRIFNPVLQGEKFDGDGTYVRRYVPEIAALPDRYLHRPFEADDKTLRAHGITLGKTYPKPVIDHGLARERALNAFQGLKEFA